MRTSRLWLALVAALASLLSLTGVATPAEARTATAAIKGQVLSYSDPIDYARVTVYNARTGRVITSAVSDIDGNYTIALPAVPIKVKATKPGYLDAWAGGNDKDGAAVYTLQPGQTLEQSWDPMVLYLDLAPEAVVSGVVHGVSTNPRTACEAPLRRATVTVFAADTGQRLGSTRTDRNGTFRIGGLRAGEVKIKVTKYRWAGAWAPAQPTGTDAQVFELVASYTTDAGRVTLTTSRTWWACHR